MSVLDDALDYFNDNDDDDDDISDDDDILLRISELCKLSFPSIQMKIGKKKRNGENFTTSLAHLNSKTVKTHLCLSLLCSR